MKTRLPAFDVLVEMARNDPKGLETLRRSLTDAVIEAASTEPRRKRLQGLQFRVDHPGRGHSPGTISPPQYALGPLDCGSAFGFISYCKTPSQQKQESGLETHRENHR